MISKLHQTACIDFPTGVGMAEARSPRTTLSPWLQCNGIVCCCVQHTAHALLCIVNGDDSAVFRRPFVKRFALCSRSAVCLSLTLVYCGQTVGRIKMKLGMQVGLGPGHTVLDGDPAPPPQKGAELPSPIFGPYLLWPNSWMDQDATW